MKAPRWHDDYAAFTTLVKDLEVMFTNVINSAFEGVARVADAGAYSETYRHMCVTYSLMQRIQC